MSYSVTKSRVLQYIGIILIIGVFAGAYWYFQVYGSTLNHSQNDLNTNGLVGMWSFNGDDISGTTAYDRSGSGNNGTLANGPVAIQGKIGQALDFDGTNDYVSTADYSYSNAQAFTMSVWFRADTVSGNQVIFSKETYEYNLRLTDATLAFAYWDTGGVGAIDLSYSNVTANRWYLISITYNGSGAAYMYVDGVRVSSDTNIVNAFQNKAEALRIGGGYHISGNPGYLNGKIDEMRIYNRALSEGEIQSLYTQGGGTKVDSAVSQPQGTGRLDSGLAGYWAMDDGSGTSATDSSTNANTGTLTGGPAWTTGQIGSAVDFDGTDDYVTVADADALDVADSTHFTLTGWFNRDTFTADHTIIAKRNGQAAGDTGYVLYVDDANDDVVFEVSDGTDEYSRTSTSSFTSSGWQHVAAVFDDTLGMTIYINGTVKQDAASGTLGNIGSLANTVAFRSGAESDAGSPFDGKLDEIRLYNRVLSPDEVNQLYRLTTPTAVDTGLRGYWSFNAQDMSGSTVYDRSGRPGNSGTLTNGPTVTPGKVGQALSFDGSDDYVNAGSGTALDDLSVLTVSAWVNPQTNGTNGLGVIATKSPRYNPTTNGWAFRMQSSGRVVFLADFSTTDLERQSVGSSIPFNQWSHVVAIWDGTATAANTHIYVNGVEVSYAVSTDGVGLHRSDVSQSLVIGHGGTGTPDSAFDGAIDEVRIYNTALTAAEIQAQYAAGQSDKTNSSISQPQGTGRLDSGLAGYWKMDDGSGTSATDSSTNGITGTLNGTSTWGTGQIGSSVTFDGTDDYITAGDRSEFEMSSANSLSFGGWFKLAAYPSGNRGFLITKGGSAGSGPTYEYELNVNGSNSNKLRFAIYNDSGVSSYILTDSTTVPALDTWFHVMAIWDAQDTAIKLYYNGVLEATSTSTTSGIHNAKLSNFVIGKRDDDAESDHNGAADEVRVYSRALSADEVGQLYRLTSPTGTDTSLKGYWSFNGKDVSGTTAYDRSGAGNTGTLTNGPAITEGKLGQGLSFDGTDDYVTMGTSTALDMTSPLTISAWIKPAVVNGIYRIFTHGRNSCCGTEVSLTLRAPGNIMFEINNDSLVAGSVLSPGNWYHIVGTYDQTTAILYVNGTLNNSASYSSAISEYNNYSAIGTALNSGSPENYFNGIIDEVRMYNRALSASEIQSLYNASR